VLDVGGFIHSASQMARLRTVLSSPDLARVLSFGDQSMEQIAREMGMTQRELLRELETASGAARTELLNRIRRATARSIVGTADTPRLTWLPNPGGEVRTIEQAVEIARRNGVHIPDDIRFVPVSASSVPGGAYADYGQLGRMWSADQMVTWEQFYNRFEQIPVRISSDVLRSDEAIVAIMGHEMHELNTLRELFDANGGVMRASELYSHITPLRGVRNIHYRAWDVADELVERMRQNSGGTPPPPTTP
jgi:AraC-like DNA-binding protein